MKNNRWVLDGRIILVTSGLSPDARLTRTLPGEFMDVIVTIGLFPFGQ